MSEQSVDRRTVFVVHGRNLAVRDGAFAFLRSLGLKPLEWGQAVSLTGKGAPYVGEVLERAFTAAQAVVVLFTPDEIAYLRSEYAGVNDLETEPAAQARPNVLFEAGMALGRHPERTILVELGQVRPFSDVVGRHAIRFQDNATSRKQLMQRLVDAGCEVDTSGDGWLTAGDLIPPAPPGGGLPLGKRLPNTPNRGVRFSARYVDRGKGSGRLQITNHCSFAVHKLTIKLPAEAGDGFGLHTDGALERLPPGETASFVALRTMAGGRSHFEIAIHGERDDGTPIETSAFVDLLG